MPDPDAAREVARAAARVPDDQLADLEDLELLEEARRRGVTFTRSVTRTQIIDAAVAATAEPEPPEPPRPLGERTKDELLAEAEARGLDLPKGARKADILQALQQADDQADQQPEQPDKES